MIFVRVYDPQGHPVSDARGYFTAGPEPLPETAALTNEDGEFSLSAPKAGTYQIGCTADGFATAALTVVVASGEQVEREIYLEN